MDSEEYKELWSFAQKVSKAQKQIIPCERIAVIGLEVPHAHIHLVPINGVSDIDFSRPKLHFKRRNGESSFRYSVFTLIWLFFINAPTQNRIF